MDNAQDVERLFSWLKAPMVHYREFAPQIEVAEAVATWPLVHKAAVQAGVTDDTEPAPHGDSAIKERMARERAAMPAAAARAIQESPLPGTAAAPMAAPGAPEAPPTGEAPGRSQGPRVQAERPTPAAEPSPGPIARAAPSRPTPPVAELPAAATQPTHYPAAGRGALFGGEYRGRERKAAPRHPVADRQDRSLDAVFTRLSGGRDRLPDPRERARTSPGLGAVFGRLR